MVVGNAARRMGASLALVAAVCGAQGAFGDTLFTRLATLGGNAQTPSGDQIAVAINASGEVVSASTNSSGNLYAVVYAAGSSTPISLGVLPTSPNGAWSTGFGINASGQVVGGINAVNFSYKGYTYTPGSTSGTGGTAFNVFNQTATASSSTAYGINSAGIPVGTVSYTYLDTSNISHTTGEAFVYLNNTMYTLGSLAGVNGTSSAQAINDQNVIVGSTNDANNNTRAFTYKLTTDGNGVPNGTMVLIPTLGGSASRGYAINNSSDVAGWSTNSSSVTHAFLYVASANQTIGLANLYADSVKAEGYGLNDLDEVVGTDYSNTLGQRAALWIGSTTIDLNAWYHTNVASADANVTLTAAYGINDANQIVGIGRDSSTGQTFDFVINYPSSVPEPASVGLIGVGTLALLRRRR